MVFTATKIVSSIALLGYAHSFSLPSDGFIKVPSWKQVSEPPAEGRRYGPNWSMDEKLAPKLSNQECGAMVWAIDKNSPYVHPEMRSDFPVGEWLKSRPNLGICMSGGGLRAATCALGWYRALNHLGLLQKARYLGANSGATWTTMPLFSRQILEKKDKGMASDYKFDFAEYVGAYGGKGSALDNRAKLGKLGEILVKSNIMDFKPNEENPSFNDWCDAIEQNYVDPIMDFKDSWKNDFWLDLSNAYLWNTEGTKYILDDQSFPFPIFVASGYVSDDGSSSGRDLFPIENTPLYTGLPVDPRILGKRCKVGGGFIQGVALNAASLKNKDRVPVDSENLYFKDFSLPSPVVKIAELTGASSNFGASGDAMTKVNLQNSINMDAIYSVAKLVDPAMRKSDLSGYTEPGKYKWWSPTTGGDPVDINMVDGGMFDNLGVLALLRRGCSTIIVCNAADSDVVTTDDDAALSKFYDVAALFGVSKPYLPKWLMKKEYLDSLNEKSQVFATEEFYSLMKDMKENRKQGKPLVVRRKNLKLLKNELAGIYDCREVDMIFCFNGVVEEFDKDQQFPYIGTTECNYSLETVHKLSSLNAYNLVEGLNNVDFDIKQVDA